MVLLLDGKEPTVTTTKENINKAFKALRKEGFFARQNFWCCSGCGWSAMTETQAKSAVFYHQQDRQMFERTGTLYLAWSGDGATIVRILKEAGLEVEWDGSESTRILIKG